MSKKAFVVLLTLVLVAAYAASFILPSSAETIQTIVIHPDGSITPPTVPIQQNGNFYTFTNNISATMRIEKSNVVIDGAGYTLQGPYNGTQADVWVIGEGSNQLPQGALAQYTIGIDLANQNVGGVIIKDLNVKNFSIAMYIWTKNNTVSGNAIFQNIVGILLSGSNATITDNLIANNKQGLFFGFNEPSDIPTDITISNNGFDHNIMQINGCLCDDYPVNEPPHAWDNGKIGNYWSDYNGSDKNDDGFGDTPYIVDVQNQDRFPLINNPAAILSPTSPQAVPIVVIALAAFFIAVLTVGVVVLKKGNRKAALGTIAIAIVILTAGSGVYLSTSQTETPKTPTTSQLDFTITASSDCLRFLNNSVPTIYVPFTIPANENWKLTINCIKMGGGLNGWTDVYIYKGYWEEGSNHTCKSEDLYPILADIKSADFEIKLNHPYMQTFGSTTQESYTVFFVVPPGGPSTFHITFKPT